MFGISSPPVRVPFLQLSNACPSLCSPCVYVLYRPTTLGFLLSLIFPSASCCSPPSLFLLFLFPSPLLPIAFPSCLPFSVVFHCYIVFYYVCSSPSPVLSSLLPHLNIFLHLFIFPLFCFLFSTHSCSSTSLIFSLFIFSALCSVLLSSLTSPSRLYHSTYGTSFCLLRPLISCTFHLPIQ